LIAVLYILILIFFFADPSFVFPGLVHLVYSSDERVQSSAGDAFIKVLKYHNEKVEVICMLLDCLRYLAFLFVFFFLFFNFQCLRFVAHQTAF
jgi:hypothetical protein